MRNRREGIECIITLRGAARVSDCGPVDIEAHILGQLSIDEDVIHQTTVARTVQNGVMAHILPLITRALGAEIPDKQPHRPTRAVQFLVRPAFAGNIPHQTRIGMARIGIGHDDIRIKLLARCQPDTRGATIGAEDLIHLFPHTQQAALIGDHIGHRFGNRSNTAHGVMHAKFFFEMADQRIHGGHAKRVATDEKRVKAEGHAQAFILEALGGMCIDRTVGAQHGKSGQNLDQVP